MTLRPPADPQHFRTTVGRYRDRWYVDPLPADDTWPAWDGAVPAVSTVKGAWPKHLVPWATKTTATFAVDNADQWTGLERQAAIDLIAGASNRSRDKAAARGTGVHHVLEQLAAGQEPMVALIPEVEPYLPAARALVADLAPTWVATEAVAIHREPGWGGTLDAIVTSDVLGGTFLVDWKTRTVGKDLGAYDDEGVQLAAYATADYLIVADDDGNARRVPVPPLDGACIVAIGTDGYKVIPVDLGRATATWEALRAFWAAKADGGIIGRPLHTHKAPKAEPTPIAEVLRDVEMLLCRRAWIAGRVADIKAAGHIDALVAAWPENVPPPKVGGWDDAQVDLIAKACAKVESRHDLPFGDEGDPALVDALPHPRSVPPPDDMQTRVAPEDDRIAAFRRRIDALDDATATWLKQQWTGPRLNGGALTEGQLADFGVLLAQAESRAIGAA